MGRRILDDAPKEEVGISGAYKVAIALIGPSRRAKNTPVNSRTENRQERTEAVIQYDFNAKDGTGARRFGSYYCTSCRRDGTDHAVEDRSAGLSDATCQWGTGIPMTKQVCTGCGVERGPFVSTAYTGDGW